MTEPKKYWCAWRTAEFDGVRHLLWLGVFDEESKADAACVNDTDYISPCVMNQRLSDLPEPFPEGTYYPRLGIPVESDLEGIAKAKERTP